MIEKLFELLFHKEEKRAQELRSLLLRFYGTMILEVGSIKESMETVDALLAEAGFDCRFKKAYWDPAHGSTRAGQIYIKYDLPRNSFLEEMYEEAECAVDEEEAIAFLELKLQEWKGKIQ
jgi:hypothetical protein